MVVVPRWDIHTISVRRGHVDAIDEVSLIAHPNGRRMGTHQERRGAEEDAGVEFHVGLTKMGVLASVYGASRSVYTRGCLTDKSGYSTENISFFRGAGVNVFCQVLSVGG